MRAILKTSISFGLVNIPIKLYSATEEKALSFKMLCSFCKTPLRYKRWCTKCEKEIAWADIVKGYKLSKDEYIALTKEELESVKLKSAQEIEIIQFIDSSQLDPIYMGKNYYIVPDKSEKAYSLFKEALSVTGRIAIGKLVMKNKEHLIAIRAYKKGLVMTDLHFASEIRDIDKLEELKGLVVVKEKELRLAQALVSKLEGDFRLNEFKDKYREKVVELVKQKAEGKVIKEARTERPSQEKDLMQALKASIETEKGKKKKEEKVKA